MFLCSWDSPGISTGLGSYHLFQGIFLTQGSNLHLLPSSQILYHWATWEAQNVNIDKRQNKENYNHYWELQVERGLCPPTEGYSCGSASKEATWETLGSISGLGRSPGEGKGYPLWYSGLQSMVSQIVRQDWPIFTSLHRWLYSKTI